MGSPAGLLGLLGESQIGASFLQGEFLYRPARITAEPAAARRGRVDGTRGFLVRQRSAPERPALLEQAFPMMAAERSVLHRANATSSGASC